jgi:hypothetical protein
VASRRARATAVGDDREEVVVTRAGHEPVVIVALPEHGDSIERDLLE